MDVTAEETIWEDAGKIEAEDGEDLGPVSSLEVVKFTDRTDNPDGAIVEKVHLFAGRFVLSASFVNITRCVNQDCEPEVLGAVHERYLGVRDVHDCWRHLPLQWHRLPAEDCCPRVGGHGGSGLQ